MRLHVVSDLHVEFGGYELPEAEADVLVLAGDIGLGTSGIRLARDWSRGRPVVFVAGNHEYYRHALPRLTDELREAADGSEVLVLEDEEAVIGGVRFLGCTLWSDFEAAGSEERSQAMELCRLVLNDYTHIEHSDEGRTLRPQDTLDLHHRSRSWLAARLAEPHDGPTVVVTHHAPLIRRLPPSPAEQAIVGAFASDLTGLMGGDRVDLWIYGHTHRPADLDVDGTRVLSNPRGYPHEPVAGYVEDCVVEVSAARRP